MKQSTSYFGSSKSAEKAISMKHKGNLHYKNRRYQNAVNCYTQALFHCPWPLPRMLRQIDQCMEGLDLTVSGILYDDLVKTQESSESYDSLPSLLGQCYGNRSAALHELGQNEAVLVDIERALYAGFKKPQVFKLYRRKGAALAQLGRLEEACKVVKEYREEIDAEDNGLTASEKDKCEKDIVFLNSEILLAKQLKVKEQPKPDGGQSVAPYISDMIKLEKSHKIGRHYKAVADIPRGRCLVMEPPHAALLNTDYQHSHCAACFKDCLTLIPCILCIHPGYCSYECMYKSFRYHWLECRNAKEWAWMPWIAQLAMRIVFLTPKHVVQALVKEGRSSHSIDVAVEKAKKGGFMVVPEKDVAVLSLIAHRGKYTDEEQRNLIEKEALRAVDYFKPQLLRFFEFRDCHARTLYDLFRYHMCQLRFNTCTVTANALATLRDEGIGYSVRDFIQQKLGYAIYLNGSLFNHSCDPNVFFRYIEGNCLAAIAHLGAQKGAEMVQCYGPQLGREKKAERLNTLKRGYMFTCTCKACFNPSDDMLFREHAWDAMSCPSCEGVIPVLPDNLKPSCLKCGEVTALHKILVQREECRKMYAKALKDRDVKLLVECEKQQSKIMYSSNLELAKTRDTIAYLYTVEGDARDAFVYCFGSYQAAKEIFGFGSIECTEELNKVAHVLFKSERISEFLQIITNAIPLMELYYGPHHKDVITLRQMQEIVHSSMN